MASRDRTKGTPKPIASGITCCRCYPTERSGCCLRLAYPTPYAQWRSKKWNPGGAEGIRTPDLCSAIAVVFFSGCIPLFPLVALSEGRQRFWLSVSILFVPQVSNFLLTPRL